MATPSPRQPKIFKTIGARTENPDLFYRILKKYLSHYIPLKVGGNEK
jgi:hypothetical protein